MALVAYDNSDESDYEDEDRENTIVVTLEKKPEKSITATSLVQDPKKELDSHQENPEPNLFNLLPQPVRKKTTVFEEDDEFLHKKEVTNIAKPKAKISVPSLNDFKDVENTTPLAKPKTSNGKMSGLLSILPQPRNTLITSTKSLIPHILTQKPNQSVNKGAGKLSMPTLLKKAKSDPKSLLNDYSDDSDNEDVSNDFFAIHKPVQVPEYIEEPVDTSNARILTNTKKSGGIESFFKKEEPQTEEFDMDESMPEQSEAGSSHEHSNDLALDDEAIMKLCGSRGKRKREEIQIVNVNQQEVLAEARELLLKGLMDDTTKRVSASKKKGNEFTNQQRRKHQITYLAYQAKANEAELQNQWANNRQSKRQSQAKYGF